MRHCADNYLLSEHKSIRLEAVKTCSSLLKGTLRSLSGRRSDTVISTINEVLAKLLTVGITDQVYFSVMSLRTFTSVSVYTRGGVSLFSKVV